MNKHVFAFLLVLTVANLNAQSIEQKLTSMGLTLSAPTKPVANYVKAVRTGNLVFLAGHVSTRADGSPITGKLGKDLSVEQGYEAARLTTVSLLSTLKAELGDLGRIRRIVKVTGFVNFTPDFMAALPLNYAVEIEMVVEEE